MEKKQTPGWKEKVAEYTDWAIRIGHLILLVIKYAKEI
jgi:hypothetical protein